MRWAHLFSRRVFRVFCLRSFVALHVPVRWRQVPCPYTKRHATPEEFYQNVFPVAALVHLQGCMHSFIFFESGQQKKGLEGWRARWTNRMMRWIKGRAVVQIKIFSLFLFKNCIRYELHETSISYVQHMFSNKLYNFLARKKVCV